MQSHWSLGVLVGLPVLAVVVLLMIGGSVLASFEDALFGVMGGLATLVVVAVALSPLGYYPYKAEYHQWRPVEGRVSATSSRIISDGGKSVNQRFVFKVGADQRLYGCDDTRCATVKVGDTVHLSCKREWQYASTSGYGCRWAA